MLLPQAIILHIPVSSFRIIGDITGSYNYIFTIIESVMGSVIF